MRIDCLTGVSICLKRSGHVRKTLLVGGGHVTFKCNEFHKMSFTGCMIGIEVMKTIFLFMSCYVFSLYTTRIKGMKLT